MHSRILPPEEYGRLSVTGLHPILSDFRPEDMRVVVIEQNGEILATTTVVRTVHLESLWVKPGSGAGVIRQLLRKVVDVGLQWGRIAFAQSCRENVRNILGRLSGKKLDVETYILPLES